MANYMSDVPRRKLGSFEGLFSGRTFYTSDGVAHRISWSRVSEDGANVRFGLGCASIMETIIIGIDEADQLKREALTCLVCLAH